VSGTDIQSMFVNLMQSYKGVTYLITSFAYVSGVVFALSAIYKLKVYGEVRTMMGSQTDVKTPILMLITSAVFLYLPTALNTVMLSTYGTTGLMPLSYVTGGAAGFQDGLRAVLGMVQIIGLISFVRGWFMVAKAGNQQQHGGLGKAAIHIVGGVFAMNIALTKEILWNSVGWT
jgi:intracellular multiplication protein IcmC